MPTNVAADQLAPAISLIDPTIRSAGKSYSETPPEPAEIDAFADAMAHMFNAYLEQLKRWSRAWCRSVSTVNVIMPTTGEDRQTC